MIWQARQFQFIFPRPALVMGILNVTPDSFSDGGCFAKVDDAVAHGVAMAGQGADVLDVGGESTRPGAEPVPEAEELLRVLPVIEKLVAQVAVPISIDTAKVAVARAALKAGASIINDVFAAHHQDSAMWELVAESQSGYILTHMQGTPQTMQVHPVYKDVVAEVNDFFGEYLQHLARCGVKPEQVALDAGLGFGKGLEHNLQLLGRWRQFRKWQRPLVLGASRKSFLGRQAEPAERLAPSLACACWALEQGVEIIRCHDVRETRQAAGVIEALQERRNHAEYN
jgi:dihydropteroate synthase